MDVSFRGRDLAMAENGLDVDQGSIFFRKNAGRQMADPMKAERLHP